ncbi:MAG: peptide deformylase [Marinilabiliales bacterium]|nr:MAG: peptide deformylase [Marinilabiliales bacterium]
MIYKIYAYGTPVLRKIADEIDQDDPELSSMIENLYETMYKSDGVGLAAPQAGISKRIFVIDAEPMAEDDKELHGFKKVFINPVIEDERGEEWLYNEGCLSLPGIREDVKRKAEITISYYDENFNFFEEKYDGMKARIIQHEYDHLEGIVFTDRLSPLRKRMLKKQLLAISKGKVDVNYKMKFPGN